MDSLTKVLLETVQSSSLTKKEIAYELNKPYSTFMAEITGQERHKLGADLVLPIMKLTKSYKPMSYLSQNLGGAFIIFDQMNVKEDALHRSLVEVVKEASEFMSKVSESIADGSINRYELFGILSEGQEAIEAISQMMKLAQKSYAQNNINFKKRKTLNLDNSAFM